MAGSDWERFEPTAEDWEEYTAWCEGNESELDPLDEAFWADQPATGLGRRLEELEAKVRQVENEIMEMFEYVADVKRQQARRN